MNATMRRVRWLIPVLVFGFVLSGCTFLPMFWDGEAAAQTVGSTYAIVDTNQAETFDDVSALAAQPQVGQPFYGQDAQIDGNQPNYVVNGDGDGGNAAGGAASAESEATVTDLVTGLMWTQGADWNGDGTLDSNDKFTYGEALAYVDTLNAENYGGYSDWRLPTIKELYSLIDFGGVDVDPQAGTASHPFIDTSVFEFAYGDTSAGERIIDSQWATTTLYTGSSDFAGGAQLMFGVNFADGRIKGYPAGATLGPAGQKTFYVRYVRGSTEYGVNDFVDHGDGTIADLATGLMWSQDDSGYTMNWEEALAYVQELNEQNYLGYSDWYLPNAKELQSIVDYTRSPDATGSAAIDPMFHCTQITNEAGQVDWGYYWTSTTHVTQRGGQDAVYIAFGRGLGYMNGQFMDVHGAGCQRSDPKAGEPSHGFGPQGDVRRVDNFVRVVRADGSSTVGVGESETEVSLSPVGDVETVGVTDDQDQDFVLYAPLRGTTAYLINRDGDVVHDWALSGQPGNSVYLLEGGDLLATYSVRGDFSQGDAGGGVERLAWDGTTVWSFELASEEAQLHHDVAMLPNGRVLMLAWETKNRAEVLAAGLSADRLPDSGEVWSEMILEYDPNLDEIVWEWHLWDHRLPAGQAASENPNKVDLGFAASRRSSDWWHLNSMDYNADLDRIVVSSRNTSEIWIIDHGLSTSEAAGDSGDLLCRYGNSAAYGGSEAQVLYGQHDVEWLDGDTLLAFDNGDPRERPYSRVVEIALPDYASSPAGEFPEARIVWQYPSEQDASRDVLFADHISGAQRLANGHTLICDGVHGRFFEVTPEGETVWEYTNPFTTATPNGTISNDVFRCEAYSAAFIGQDPVFDGSSETQAGKSSGCPGIQSPLDIGTPQGTAVGRPPVLGPSGIASVSPQSIGTGTERLVTIRLEPQYAPPETVRFTRIAIGDIEATRWVRDGMTVRAWFAIPASLRGRDIELTIAFPGRNRETVTFGCSIEIR